MKNMKGAVNGALIISLFLLFSMAIHVVESRVAYDRRALVVNGQRRILFSGSMHYARSTSQMWEDLIRKAKDGGLDVIQTYVFWNGHEPSPGKYNFKGRFDLVRFVKTVHKAGLYVHLRLGPYSCAEWNFGGFPVWLKYVPGISFRTDNKPFKTAMHNFTRKIVHMMKDEKLYQSQGGPIILSQIENEYGGISKMIGAQAKSYISWAAKMAVGLNTGVPWVMCKQDDAPDPVINTCNGFYCDSFTPNKPSKPKIWTEAWTSWFSYFGGPVHKRPVEDLAFAVARFIQNGGSFINYYMYHGGTNFGRTAGGPFITTTYYFDAPIDEYGLINAPKYDHLTQLHLAIKQCEKALVSTYPNITSFGNLKQVNVFSSESDGCAAFLTNYSPDSTATFHFNSKTYKLPPWSVSILQDCRKEVYNTAKVKAKPSQVQMVPSRNNSWFSWKTRREAIPSPGDSSLFSLNGLLEQINVTRDKTDYLWYTTNVYVSPYEAFLLEGHSPVLTVHSQGHGLHVFINGNLSGTYYGNSKYKRFRFSCNATLQHGLNSVALLSVAVGLPNIGLHYETRNTGIIGPVLLYGLGKRRDLSQQKWYYQVGLQGEEMSLPTRSSSLQWKKMSTFDQTHVTQPLTWHKAIFDAPTGKEPLGLNMGSMVKGHVWINGQSIGRYWTRLVQGNCTGCRITSTYRPRRCQTKCGRPTQRWYHLPRSWLRPRKNVLVVFEEMRGYPSQITLARRLRYSKFTKKASDTGFGEVNFVSSFNGHPNQTNLLNV